MRNRKGAHRKGAPFSLLLTLGLAAFATVSAWAAPCGPERVDETTRVTYVFDGDTVRLASGERVRLIGLDAPERGRDGGPGEPHAEAARRALQGLLGGAVVRLQYGVEERDSYGRRLAHLWDERQSVNAWLLARGHAFPLAIPPNLYNAGCYERATEQARQGRLGIWALDAYRPVASATLRAKDEGHRVVEGRVRGVGESRRSVWLELDGPVAVRIPKSDLGHFDEDPRRLQGRRVLVIGRWRHHQGKLRATVRHPVTLKALDGD